MSDVVSLRACLRVAVPLHVAELQLQPWRDVRQVADAAADVVAGHGDAIEFPDPATREAFNALARGLAALSFAPGGVMFLGDHYEAEHSDGPHGSVDGPGAGQ